MSIRPRIAAATLVRTGEPIAASPWTRYVLSEALWAELVERLQSDPLPLAGMWSDGEAVHALLLESPDAPLIASVRVDGKRVLAVSPARPQAVFAERILRDLWGIEAMGARDLRPWLDHGVWTQTAPLSARPGPAAWPPEPPEFEWSAADEAAGAMQRPVGPVQTLLFGPAQLRVTLVGERIRRLEPLLGYAHRGVAARLRGLSPAEAAPLVARIDAMAGVAHQSAFAQAVEAASAWPVDSATRTLRSAMGALERIGLRLRQANGQSLRAMLLEASALAFGHRLMRGSIVPGGWARMPDEVGLDAVQAALARIEASVPLLSATPALLSAIRADLALARRSLAVPPPVGQPDRSPPAGIREGLASAESVHGPIWHWVRLDGGRIAAWHAVDPVLSRLAELVERAPGLSLPELDALCGSLDLPVAGADQ